MFNWAGRVRGSGTFAVISGVRRVGPCSQQGPSGCHRLKVSLDKGKIAVDVSHNLRMLAVAPSQRDQSELGPLEIGLQPFYGSSRFSSCQARPPPIELKMSSSVGLSNQTT